MKRFWLYFIFSRGEINQNFFGLYFKEIFHKIRLNNKVILYFKHKEEGQQYYEFLSYLSKSNASSPFMSLSQDFDFFNGIDFF